MPAIEGARLTVTITGLTLTCAACGDTVRVDHRTSEQVAEAGSRWMVSHLDPELVAVEVEGSDGESAEWVAASRRLR
jgi:hypothetical protein